MGSWKHVFLLSAVCCLPVLGDSDEHSVENAMKTELDFIVTHGVSHWGENRFSDAIRQLQGEMPDAEIWNSEEFQRYEAQAQDIPACGTMVPFADLLHKEFGSNVSWSAEQKQFFTTVDGVELTFPVEGTFVNVGGTSIQLTFGIVAIDSVPSISVRDWQGLLLPLFRPELLKRYDGKGLILIDPGHGGNESGAVRGDVKEKDFNFAIAQTLVEELEKRGYQVEMTRTEDTDLSLQGRMDLAAGKKCDLFVSVHNNAAGKDNPEANGTETYVTILSGGRDQVYGDVEQKEYVNNQFDANNAVLGYWLQKNLVKQIGSADRGVRHSRFYVLRNAPCPSVLVETLYMSNDGDFAKLQEPEHPQRCAQALADGIDAYFSAAGKGRQ